MQEPPCHFLSLPGNVKVLTVHKLFVVSFIGSLYEFLLSASSIAGTVVGTEDRAVIKGNKCGTHGVDILVEIGSKHSKYSMLCSLLEYKFYGEIRSRKGEMQ